MEFQTSATILERFQLCEIQRIYQDFWEIQILNSDSDLFLEFNGFSLWWIDTSAEKYRNQWFTSKCCNCQNWHLCGWEARMICDEFEE